MTLAIIALSATSGAVIIVVAALILQRWNKVRWLRKHQKCMEMELRAKAVSGNNVLPRKV